MVSWRVTSTNPNSGTVEDFGGGSFKFPQNSTTSSIVYTVEYTDDAGNVSTGSYTVLTGETCQPSPSDCTCNDLNVGSAITSYTYASGTDTVRCKFNDTQCSGTIGVTSSTPSWLHASYNSGYISIAVDANENGGARSGTVTPTVNSIICTSKAITISQEAKPACSCQDLNVGSAPSDIAAAGGNATVTWSLPSTCKGTVGVSSDKSWCTVTTASTSQGNVFSISASTYEYSPGVTNRTATITPTVGGVNCTTKKFTVTQLAPSPGACTCSDFSASTASVSFTSNGGSSDVTFGKKNGSSCTGSLSDLTFTRSDSWITTAYTASTGVLRVSAGPIFDKCSGKAGSITVSYNGSPCNDLTITVEQSRVPCDCNAVSFSSTGTIPASGGNTTFGNVETQGCGCQVTFVSSDDSWLTASITSSGLTAIATATQSQRTGTITVYVNGNPCGTCTLTQSAPGPECTCNDFTVTGNTSIGYNSQTSVVIGTCTLPSCTGSITRYTSNVDWVSYLNCIDGTVYGNVTENTITSPRDGTLSVEWSGGGLTCNKSVIFTQERGVPRLKLTANCNLYDRNHSLIKEASEPFIISESGGSFAETVYIRREDIETKQNGIIFDLKKDDGIPGAVYLDFGPYSYIHATEGTEFTVEYLCDTGGTPFSTNKEYMMILDHVLCADENGVEASTDWITFENGITYLSSIDEVDMFIPKNYLYRGVIALRFIYSPTIYTCGGETTSGGFYKETPTYKGDAIRVNLNIVQF